MATRTMTIGLIALAASACLGVGAEAGNNRSVVSTTGLDTNNCSVPQPCRSFAAALAQTNPSGEIIVLDSGGYGPATITQPVTISAPTGVRASVFTATNINGLTINTTGNVTVKGISFLGGGNGKNGIEVVNVAALYLDSVEVQDFLNDGIAFFVAAQKLFVANSVVKDCGMNGLHFAGGSAYVRGSSFLNNGNGVEVDFGNVVLVDSAASFNAGGGVAAIGASLHGTVHLMRVETVSNGGAGLIAEGTGVVHFDYSLSAGSVHAFQNQGVVAGTMSGSSPGTSVLIGDGNGTTLSTADPLQ